MLVEVQAAAVRGRQGRGGEEQGDGGGGGRGGGVLVLRADDILHVGAGGHGQTPGGEDLQCQQVSPETKVQQGSDSTRFILYFG